MPLADVDHPPLDADVPADVRRFLRDARRRIDRFQREAHAPAFVPSDYEAAYRGLKAVADHGLARGPQFCEWGSGFGVVAGLAAFLGFDSCGIEVEAELVAEARHLADDHGLAVEFVQGSFVPPGGDEKVVRAGEYAWFTTESDAAYDELGLDVADLDIVFAYPWPDEEAVTADLFDRYAGPGALLVTYSGMDGIKIRRKVGRRGKRR